MKTLTNHQLTGLLFDYETQISAIKTRLKEPHLSEVTVRELHKSQNELIADVQAIKMELEAREEATPTKSFERILNESTEL